MVHALLSVFQQQFEAGGLCTGIECNDCPFKAKEAINYSMAHKIKMSGYWSAEKRSGEGCCLVRHTGREAQKTTIQVLRNEHTWRLWIELLGATPGTEWEEESETTTIEA